MTTLPDEILLCNILPWLPSKTLVRFMSVCKSWHSFISHSSFFHLRTVTFHNHTTHHLLFLSPNPQAPVVGISQPHVFSTPFNPNNHIITTTPSSPPTLLFTVPNLNFSETRLHCVKGLLCFHPSRYVWFDSRVNAFTVIANPTTRQVVTLPIDEAIDREFRVSTHFGYDPVRDEFKVLRLIKYRGCHEYKIFTIGGDTSWRVIAPEKPFALMDCLLSRHKSKRGLCVNGAIYWTYGAVLLAFDVGSEKLRVMRVPSGYLDLEENVWGSQYPDLVEIDGCLCLVGYSGSDLKLWILRDYEAQVWEEKSVVLPSEVVSQQGVFYPLCRVCTGEILLVSYFLTRRVRGIYYDMDTMNSRSVVVMEMPQSLWPDKRPGEDDIFFCEESFRLLK